MSPDGLVKQLGRSVHLGLALLQATATRPASPLKLNLCLTYWCQYRCKTCNIWTRKPTDELTTAELLALVRENPHINWVDLTGGEIFLRQDIDDIFDAILTGWSRLAILHFPTNGFQTDRIVRSVERIARRRASAEIVVTVSLDGDETLNDEIRGIKGGFRRQIATFQALRRIPGIVTALGMTLSAYNVNRISETFAACAGEIPGLRPSDVHVNVAQKSGHYYGNADADGVTADAATARVEIGRYRQLKGLALSPRHLLENSYLKNLERFLETGRTPMPCHALRSSCFIDPWGVVYPCIAYSRPIGRLRDTGMRLEPIWQAVETAQLQGQIWKGECPQCWTACEAYQSILGNALALRRRSGVSPMAAEEQPAR